MLTESRIDGQADVCKRSPHYIQVHYEFQSNGSSSKILQKLIVPVIDQEECRKIYARYLPVTSNMLCAGKGEKDTCQVCFQSPINIFLFVDSIMDIYNPSIKRSCRISYQTCSGCEMEY